jgi:hypothetical protein
MTDPDVPADLSALNKEGTTIAKEVPRMEFTHGFWLTFPLP